MGGNSFGFLLVGLFTIAIAGIATSFGTAWSLVASEYATSPAPTWIMVGGLTATSAMFKIKLAPEQMMNDLSLLSLVIEPVITNNNNTNNQDETINDNDNDNDNLEIPNRMEIPLAQHQQQQQQQQQQEDQNSNSTSATSSSTTSGSVSWEKKYGIHTLHVGNLSPRQAYSYSVQEQPLIPGSTKASVPDNALTGTFQTPALAGTRFNFTIATAGCAWTGSKASVFQHVQTFDPLLFVHLGDFHYEDIATQEMQQRIDAISTVLASTTQSQLYRSTAFVGMWDDHDWLGNNANGATDTNNNNVEEGARETALLSYQMAFPHYELPALGATTSTTTTTTSTTTTTTTTSSDNNNSSSSTTTNQQNNNNNNNNNNIAPPPVSVYQAFTIGTIRFIVSDLRSQSTATNIYSEEQRQWLANELRAAANYDYVIWVTTRPWIGQATPNDDSWAGYSQDRSWLSTFISTTLGTETGPQNLLALASDAHMVAFDDGTNTYYGYEESTDSPDGRTGTNGTVRSFPILQSGSLDRIGSSVGEHFTDGCYAFQYERTHQFSTVKFEFGSDENENDDDDDDNKCIQIDSYRVLDFSGEGPLNIFSKRMCGKLFVPAATSDETKVGVCQIGDMSEVNNSITITATIITGVAIIISCLAFQCSDSADLGDCCCKSFMTTLIAVGSFFVTAALGLGVFFGRGVGQYTLTPIAFVVLSQSVLFCCYVFIWWVCCTSPNRRRRDENDPSFIDVDPNPNINRNDLSTNYDDAGLVPGNTGTTRDSVQVY